MGDSLTSGVRFVTGSGVVCKKKGTALTDSMGKIEIVGCRDLFVGN